MLREWERKYPGRIENMFTALQNVVPSHLLDGNALRLQGSEGHRAWPTRTATRPSTPPNFPPAPSALRIVQL